MIAIKLPEDFMKSLFEMIPEQINDFLVEPKIHLQPSAEYYPREMTDLIYYIRIDNTKVKKDWTFKITIDHEVYRNMTPFGLKTFYRNQREHLRDLISEIIIWINQNSVIEEVKLKL